MDMAPSNSSCYEGTVCISCCCNCYNYSFLIVDLEASSGLIDKSPSFKIQHESLRDVRLCVSDPYLYVIGCDDDDDFNGKPGQVWMSKYDLSMKSSSSSTIEIGPSALLNGRVGKMNHPKWNPGITASPDGRRVVVYSRTIECATDSGEELIFGKKDVDFEVFDTKSENWTPLPQLILCTLGSIHSELFYIKPRNDDDWIQGWGGHLCNTSFPCYYSSHLEIDALKFINQNTLHVTFQVGLMFTLNLDSLEEGWKHFRDDHIRALWDDFVIVEPEPLAVFTPCDFKVIRSKDKQEFKHHFDLSSPNYPTRYTAPEFRVFLLKYVENLECITCTVTHGLDEHTGYPFLICDVFKLNLVPGDENDFRPIPYGSFKYLLKRYCSCFSVEGVVPFSTAIEAKKRQELACMSMVWHAIEAQKRQKLVHTHSTSSS